MEGRNFHILTDHKPLTFAISSQASHHTPRQIRHLDYISQFTTDIQHVKGEDDPVANMLSRLRQHISNRIKSKMSAIHCDTIKILAK